MIVKYKKREVKIDGISGTMDEPTIDNAFYLDGDEETLTPEEIEELVDLYGDKLADELSEKYIDDVYDRYNDR